MSDVSELAGDLERLEEESVTAAPASIQPKAEHTYWAASDVLGASSTERAKQEAGHVAARLAVLAGWASLGVGDYTGARSWYTRARHRALFADDVDTLAWVYAREATVPLYYGGYTATTGELAERGLNFLPVRHRNKHPAASLLLLRAGQAYAESGSAWEARMAVDAAERIRPGPSGSQLHLGPGEQAQQAARVFVELGDVDEADARHAAAAPASSGQWGLVGLHRARGLAATGKPDEAAATGEDTWRRLPAEQRSVPLRFIARKLAFELAPWRGQPHVDQYRDLIDSGI